MHLLFKISFQKPSRHKHIKPENATNPQTTTPQTRKHNKHKNPQSIFPTILAWRTARTRLNNKQMLSLIHQTSAISETNSRMLLSHISQKNVISGKNAFPYLPKKRHLGKKTKNSFPYLPKTLFYRNVDF